MNTRTSKEKLNLVGQDFSRKDEIARVTGREQYTCDIGNSMELLAGMLR